MRPFSVRLPAARHWFGGVALIGLFNTVYWTIVAVIGIAPIAAADLKWGLLACGGILCMLSWWAVALAQEGAADAREQSNRIEDGI